MTAAFKRAEIPPAPISEDLARRIGANEYFAEACDRIKPQTRLDWAIHWARTRNLRIFPCEEFLGRPMIGDFYRKASNQIGQIVEWWIDDGFARADIGCIPDENGYYVICGIGERGRASLGRMRRKFDLQPEFEYLNRWGSRHLWIRGHAVTSWDHVAPGIRVAGPGQIVHLPDSMAADPHTFEDELDDAG